MKKTARIPLTDLTGKYYTFDFKATANRIGNATIGIGHMLHKKPANIDKDSEFLQEQVQDGHSHWVIRPIPEEQIVPTIDE